MFWQKESKSGVLGSVSQVLRVIAVSTVRADKVLVLAPHPDDDVMGCGGIIKALSDGGAKIKVIYFSDGSRGTKSGKADESLIEEREKEAREAGRILGVGEEKFLRLADGKIAPSLDLATRVRRELEFDSPDLILAPSMEDLHPDHHAVAEILVMSLKNYDRGVHIWLYEVWGASRFNRLFIIDDYLSAKQEAFKCHKSQMKIKRYDEAILALNKYRALMMDSSEYAEAFYATGPRNFRKLFEFYSRHHESKI